METLNKPWLVAVWPGMGGVAQIAGAYLAENLKASSLREVETAEFFEPRSVAVKDGVASPIGRPRSVFYAWRDPNGVRDLVFAIGDAQPTHSGYRYCQLLLDAAKELGVERVVTFAAMATPIHPTADPRVFGVASSAELAQELRQHNVTLLESGEVAGLNGLCVAAAAERGLPALCLLGEFPFYAAAIPNPKASVAVLRAFAGLSGVSVDLHSLRLEGRRVERGLVEHLDNLQKNARLEAGAESQAESNGESELALGSAAGDPRAIDPELAAKLEQLFERARTDRSQAFELKRELDRHRLFDDYQDRFLDLFKPGA